jgi:competence protein ComEC
LDCDILSISHHGSKYSSSEEFLQATTPKYAIISCGKNNFYGHPAGEILDRLQRHGSKVYRTDIYGAIEFLLGNSGISYQKAGER